MKIAFIVPGGVDRSGIERVIPHYLWLFEELSKSHEIHIISLYLYPKPCEYKLLGANVYDLGNIKEDWEISNEPQLALKNTFAKTLEILQSYGPWDLIHGFRATQTGWLAATSGLYLNTPSVVSFLGAEVNADIEHYVWRTARLASCLTVASKFMANIVKLKGFNTHLIPFGAHESCFQQNETQDKSPWKLLSVADINAVKDHLTMLNALKYLIDHRQDIHLDIIGFDVLNGKLHSAVAELGLSKYVTLHGSLPNHVVRPFFQQAHIYLVTSRHEGGPIAMLEAAACGVPTVGTAVGYVADWAGERAIAVPHNDPNAMAAAILHLLADAPRRRALGDAARDWARRHDSRWTAENFLRLYRSLH